MTGQIVTEFFAWAPLTVFIVIVIVAYFALREPAPAQGTLRKTFACASCGRRGDREHMLPVTHEGAVVWYCSRCSH